MISRPDDKEQDMHFRLSTPESRRRDADLEQQRREVINELAKQPVWTPTAEKDRLNRQLDEIDRRSGF